MAITEQAVQAASDAASKVQNMAGEYAGRAKEAAGNIAGQAREYASNAAHSAAHALENEPVTNTAASIPTEAFIIAAGASIAGSLVLKLLGRQKDADFVGHWAPTLISLGLLSKLVEHTRSSSNVTPRTPMGENL
jgi:hypothetical protein